MFGAAELDDGRVESAVRGDSAAVSQLLEVLGTQVQTMVAARLNPDAIGRGAAEDLSQEVLAALAANLPSLRIATVAGLRGFVSKIVHNKVIDYLRAQPRGVSRPGSLDSTVAALSGAGPLWQMLSQSGTSPLSAAARAEHSLRVLEEMNQLKPEHRAAITLAFFDQLTTAQIAEQMSISRPAASMLLIRAIEALRKRCKPIVTSE
jgi:RNA polymerase sigma factor (sigma-70 family)